MTPATYTQITFVLPGPAGITFTDRLTFYVKLLGLIALLLRDRRELKTFQGLMDLLQHLNVGLENVMQLMYCSHVSLRLKRVDTTHRLLSVQQTTSQVTLITFSYHLHCKFFFSFFFFFWRDGEEGSSTCLLQQSKEHICVSSIEFPSSFFFLGTVINHP